MTSESGSGDRDGRYFISSHYTFRANAAWEAAKTDKEGADGEKEELNTKIAELEHEVRIKTSEADLFKGNMANILSTPDLTVEATFEAIRDHIKNNHTQFVNR